MPERVRTMSEFSVISQHGGPGHKFTYWVAVAFTLNYIVGSGFLTLPWAFDQTGVLLGVLVLLVFGFYAVIAVLFLLEAGARASALVASGFYNPHLFVRHAKLGYGAIASTAENGHNGRLVLSVVDDESSHSQKGTFEIVLDESKSAVNANHKFEIPELCEMFLGPKAKQLYTIFITVYLYGCLWAYGTVFANSFASHLPTTLFGPDGSYHLYLAVFAAIVVPLSLLELSEQIHIQVILSVFRVVMLLVMLFSVGVSLATNTPEFGKLSPNEDRGMKAFSFHPEKLYLLLPIAAYAFIFHHSVPSLAHPVEEKEQLGSLFTVALVFCFVAYCAIGGVVSLYFGHNINGTSNLCWEFFVGIRSADGGVPLYAQLLSFFVVLFPAVDVASAFPLNAYTLGNNMMSAFYGQKMRKEAKKRWKLNLFRALAAFPPIVGAWYVRDLGTITDYTGLIAFVIMFVFPALLSRYSDLKLRSVNVEPRTIHSGCLTSCFFQYLVFVSGVALLGFVGWGLISAHHNGRWTL